MRSDQKQSAVLEHHRVRPDHPGRLSTNQAADYQIRQKLPKPALASLRLADYQSSEAHYTPYSLRPGLKQRARTPLRKKWRNIACQLHPFLLELENIATTQWMIAIFGSGGWPAGFSGTPCPTRRPARLTRHDHKSQSPLPKTVSAFGDSRRCRRFRRARAFGGNFANHAVATALNGEFRLIPCG